MIHQTEVSHLLILRPLASIIGIGIDGYTTARSKDPGYFNIFRIHQTDEIFHDLVDAVFMEVAVIAKTEQI